MKQSKTTPSASIPVQNIVYIKGKQYDASADSVCYKLKWRHIHTDKEGNKYLKFYDEVVYLDRPAPPSIPVKDELNDKTLWRDDNGFIAQGTGDNYKTFVDTNVNDDDIDDRERRTDEIIAAYNGTIVKGYNPAAMGELYKALQMVNVYYEDSDNYEDFGNMVSGSIDLIVKALSNAKI